MGMGLALFGRQNKGKKTQNANTKINIVVPPKAGYRTVIESLGITCGATAHTVTFLRPIGSTTIPLVTAAAASTFLVAALPGTSQLGPNGTASQVSANTFAAADNYVVPYTDGTFFYDIAAVVSTLTITPTASINANIGFAAGATLWDFGVAADNYPRDPEGNAHMAFTVVASQLNTWSDEEVGICATDATNEPIIVQVNNITNASVIEWLTYGYVRA